VARATVARAGLDDLRDVVVDVTVAPGSPSVTVTVRARAHYLFSGALPGGHGSIAVSASSTATATEDRR
jgi:hypothetical protein